jgi:hypothetical protein
MDTVSCLNTRSLAIPVEIGRLVHDMSSNLYAAYGSRVGTSSKSQHKFGWVVAQRDLPGMVFNFISTQNYYVEVRCSRIEPWRPSANTFVLPKKPAVSA